MAQGHSESPLSHVLDHDYLELPAIEIFLPEIFGLQITRFMVMEVIAALLVALTAWSLSRHLKKYRVSRGPIFNILEATLLFIRDSVARPMIGREASDAYLPLLWSLFLFILYSNLLGLVPGFASPTGNLSVTGVLAVTIFATVLMVGIKKQGVIGFFVGLVPSFEAPPLIRAPLWILMFVIEIVGLVIRHCVLALRLFANMLAGHIVLAVLLGFALAVQGWLQAVIGPLSIIGSVPMNILEILVAVLQAYIFTLLSSVFIASAQSAHH